MIVGNSAVLLAKALYTKETEEKCFVIVDAAVNDLLRPALYGAFHFVWPIAPVGGAVPPARRADVKLDGVIDNWEVEIDRDQLPEAARSSVAQNARMRRSLRGDRPGMRTSMGKPVFGTGRMTAMIAQAGPGRPYSGYHTPRPTHHLIHL